MLEILAVQETPQALIEKGSTLFMKNKQTLLFINIIWLAGLWCCGREADLAQLQREAAQRIAESNVAPEKLLVMSPDTLVARLDQLEQYENELFAIDTSRLKANERKLWKQTHNALQGPLKKLREHRDDPAVYNLGGMVKRVLTNDTLSDEARWKLIAENLEQAPAYYQNAQNTLKHPGPQRLRLAVQKQMLSLRLLNGELRDSLQTAALPPSQRRYILRLIPPAQSAIKDYIVFCNNVYFR